MQNNDLSNTPQPTVYVVWEELLATCGDMPKVRLLLKLRRYQRALDMFETHSRAVNAMWQAMTRGTYGVSVVTHLPKGLADLLIDRLDYDLVPYREFVAMSAHDFIQQVPHMPWVLAVADPDPFRARAHGSLGRFIPAEHAERIGTLL
jgi:hypothetical protein